MSARNSRFGAFSSRSGMGKAAGAVIACAVILLAGCGGSDGADAGAPVIRGDAAVPGDAEDPLTVVASKETTTADKGIDLSSAGGSGTGYVRFTVTGTGCSVLGNVTLSATDAAICIVTARKAESTGYPKSTSTPKTLTFTAAPSVAQAALSVSNTVLTDAVDDGVGVELATSGGSGDGVVTYTVTGTGCSVSGTSLSATPPATCVVTATKAASKGYLVATSATATFTFLAYQGVLRVEGETLTAKVGNAIELTTSGGSGTGAVTFKVEGGACLFDGKKRLIATGVTVCIVTAKKAASTGYLATESESKTFSYTKK